MDQLKGRRLAVVSNVHTVHDCRAYYREAVFAARAGMQVSIYAIDDGCSSECVTQHAFRAPKSRWQRFSLGWKLAFLAYRDKAEICHFHDPEMLLPMSILRLVKRIPVIYDCHENVVDAVYYKPYIPRMLRPTLSRIVFALQWLCSRALGAVIVATEEQLEMFPRSIRSAIVRNLPPLFIQECADPPANRPYDLVHCGGVYRQRGSDVLFEILRMLVHDRGRSSCNLLLVGARHEHLEPRIQQFIAKWGLERNITFRGSVPLHEVPKQLRMAKIGLMCHQRTKQYRYGVASKLFDYMAAELAIVGGQADFDREFAPEGTVKIYVDERSPQQYVDAIERLLDDKQLREEMGRNARRLYEERYTAESQSATLLDFYRAQMFSSKAA